MTLVLWSVPSKIHIYAFINILPVGALRETWTLVKGESLISVSSHSYFSHMVRTVTNQSNDPIWLCLKWHWGLQLKNRTRKRHILCFIPRLFTLFLHHLYFWNACRFFLHLFHGNDSLFPDDKLNALIGDNTNVEWKAKEKVLKKNLQIAIKKEFQKKGGWRTGSE